uniref:aminotransferase class III-fold pyridoxal phosphate-dependent enzyme n=1 Tax=Mesorhizobium amorphae TaxID=71433 RepID=UPI00177F0699
KKTFFHSSSYTANPIACAAALANVEIWQDEPVVKRIAALSAMQGAGLRRFRDNTNFTDCRATGTIVALDLRAGSAGYLAQIGPKLRTFFLDQGLLVRPLGNVLYLLPPYCITGDELDGLYDAIEEAGERFGSRP